MRELEVRLERKINELASEINETRIDFYNEKMIRGENEVWNKSINNEQSSNLKGFLAKQSDSLKKENDQLKEQINNYKCITSDLNQKLKDLDNERSSLITVIKILQNEQEQHKTEALSSWNVVNRHKKTTKSRNASEQNPSGKNQQLDLQLQNQFIVLSECESDNNETTKATQIGYISQTWRQAKTRQSGDKPNQSQTGKIVERSKDASNPKETHKIVSQIWTNRKIKTNPSRQNRGNLTL